MTLLLPRSLPQVTSEGAARIAILPVSVSRPAEPRPSQDDTPSVSAIVTALSGAFPLRVLPSLTILDPPCSALLRTLPALLDGISEGISRPGLLVLVTAHADHDTLATLTTHDTATGTRLAIFPTTADWTAARNATRHTPTNDTGQNSPVLRTLLYRFRDTLPQLAAH